MSSTRYQPFMGNNKDTASLYAWVQGQIPSVVENITPYLFTHSIPSTPWLILFSTPWCGPCNTFNPYFEEVAGAIQGYGVKSGKVNCEKFKGLCSKVKVNAYPTVRLYWDDQNREVVDKNVKDIIETVKEWLDEEEEEEEEEKESAHDEL